MSEIKSILKTHEKEKVLNFKDKSKTYKFTWKELNELKTYLTIPEIQGALNKDKIEQMKESYHKYPHYLSAKSLLVIAHTKVGDIENYYLVDGQHRLQMAIELYNEDDGNNEVFLVSIIEITNEEDLISLFMDVNSDSSKCVIKPGTFEEFKMLNYINLKSLLSKNYDFLSEKASSKSSLYTISEFIEELTKNNFIKKAKLTKHSAQEIFDFIKLKEKEFFNKICYLEKKINNYNFKHKEIISIDKKSCLFMKKNNFIEWLIDPSIEPIHDFTERKSIPTKIKNLVWTEDFGSKTNGKCPIYGCDKVLSLDIINSWQCGHLISVKNGGKTISENLRPICTTCNQSMSDKNWDDWVYERMKNKIREDHFEDSTDTIKCKMIKCKNIISSYNFYILKFESSNKIKPVCLTCYNKI